MSVANERLNRYFLYYHYYYNERSDTWYKLEDFRLSVCIKISLKSGLESSLRSAFFILKIGF